MKAADIIIAWTPAEAIQAQLAPHAQETAGQVAVLPWPTAAATSGAYARVFGGPEVGWGTADEDGVLARLRIAFRTLVMRDGVNPMAVHASFLQIDEYRREIFREQTRDRRSLHREVPAPADLRRIG